MTGVPAQSIAISIDDASKVGEARRIVRAMSERLGFDETTCGKAAIVVSEAATNLHKYGQHGELVLQGFGAESAALDILAVDKGPGMTDIGRCMTDGFSTSGSAGNGLGAMNRLSTLFEIHSSTDCGTVLVARIWPESRGESASFEFGVINLPTAGEEVCGDAWAVEVVEGRTLVMLVDGLGHGLPAAEASREAVASFQRDSALSIEQIIRRAHDLLRKTRGAAMAVGLIDNRLGVVRFSGIGNISGLILSPNGSRTASLMSHNGTVGHVLRKVQEFVYPWIPGSLLVMHSDGLSTHWNLESYPGLASKHPSLVAGVLYRDYSRERDDVTVLVGRERKALMR